MTKREIGTWWAAGFGLLALFLWGFAEVLAPFLFGAAIAYLAHPLVDRLDRAGTGRVIATLLVTLLFVVGVLVALVLLVPLLLDQAQRLVANAPGYLAQAGGWLEARLDALFPDLTGTEGWFVPREEGWGEAARAWSLQALRGVLTGSLAVVDALAVAVITPIVAFYLLLDWDQVERTVDGLLPRRHAPTIRMLARQIDRVLARFLRGQLTVCLVLGAFYAIALTAVGLDFALVVGVFAGIISFVPFLGSAVGLVLSVGLAIAQFWGDWWMIGLVAGIFIAGQLVEGNVLTPLLVGGEVGLHPVWLIFALSAFGYAFGFAGLLVAVPVAAALGVVARWAVARYQESDLYTGGASE